MIPRYTPSASGLPPNHRKVAAAQRLSLIRSPDAPYLCEISGLELHLTTCRRKEVVSVCVPFLPRQALAAISANSKNSLRTWLAAQLEVVSMPGSGRRRGRMAETQLLESLLSRRSWERMNASGSAPTIVPP
jgi:hypothetical protein